MANENDNEVLQAVFSRVPMFCRGNIEGYFIQFEAWFKLNKITADNSKFTNAVAYFDPSLLCEVHEAVVNPPAEGKFENLKKAILARFADSENQRVNKLLSGIQLGDKRPSQLLNELKKLGGSISEEILRNLFINRLPIQARAIVSAAKGTLVEVAAVADVVVESLSTHAIYQVDSAPKPLMPIQSTEMVQISMLQQQIAALSKSFADFSMNQGKQRDFHGRSRSKSRNRSLSKNQRDSNENTTCWYHCNYGLAAKRCRPPCNFSIATSDTGSKN